MFKNYKNKKLFLVFFLIIFAVGIFLRSFHFSDWLIFQSDQSRDALIVHSAVAEGFNKLPLIGPQARGSGLHLGPIFYYFQYLSGKIFGPRPESFSYPDLIFGILTLPLFFLLLKKFVLGGIALGVTALASVSIFLVTFSRFAWNPNSLPFFTTLFALLFISAIKKNDRRWYLLGSAVCFGIIFQLHFIAALSLLISIFIFLILCRPFKWKELLFCLSIIIILQIPTLTYEIRNKGAVSEAFLETVEDKGSQDSKHGIHEKVFRAFQSQAEIFWIATTGQQNTDSILTRGFSLKCDNKCKLALPATIASLVLFASLVLLGFAKWKKEEDINQKKVFIFLGLWFLCFFFITVLVAYQISTRFYLGIAPLIFLLIAFAADWFWNTKSKFLRFSIFLTLSLSIALNFFATKNYLKELSMAKDTPAETERDLVFGTEQKVTLNQLRLMAEETNQRFSDNGPIFISGESRYVRSIYYLLFTEKGRTGCYLKGSVDEQVLQNHVKIVKNKSQKNIIPFGTMGIQLSASETANNNIFPNECLNF